MNLKKNFLCLIVEGMVCQPAVWNRVTGEPGGAKYFDSILGVTGGWVIFFHRH
ncbi:MAG: hypothetical protein JWO94_3423 [Verrucomicrobiaceae bacterium]|nr:hypothetical protein [Verrucomicrobiaceae bacterium]